MPDVITRTEYVEINGLPLATPAWEATDFAWLWDVPPTRGEDRLIPYKKGRQPIQRIYDENRGDIFLYVYGDKSRTNAAHPDPRTGLWLNRTELVTNIADPEATAAPGLKEIKLHAPGVVLVGECIVNTPLHFAPFGPGVLKAVIDVTIPDGELVPE